MSSTQFIKAAACVILISFAVVRILYYEILSESMDEVFLALVGTAILVWLIPWERLVKFKAGGFELTLDTPQITGALEGLCLNRVENETLRKTISKIASDIEQARGSRILWIDDKPHTIISERRLLRALGVEIVPAISSEMAENILEKDNDFDMIITDVQRRGESYKPIDGVPIHEGVNFIVKLRKHPDPIIKAMPVAFYAAYKWPRLVKFTRPARETLPEPQISNSIEALLINVFSMLADVRSNPIGVRPEKKPTRV